VDPPSRGGVCSSNSSSVAAAPWVETETQTGRSRMPTPRPTEGTAVEIGIRIRIGIGIADDGRMGSPDLSGVLVSHRGTIGIGSRLEPEGRFVQIPRCGLQSLGDGLDEDLGKKVFCRDAAVYEPVM